MRLRSPARSSAETSPLTPCETEVVTATSSELAWRSEAIAPRKVSFYALPANADSPPAASTPLYEYAHADGRREYSTDADAKFEGFVRTDQPSCRVWKNPYREG